MVAVKVLDVDVEKERISLGIKQLAADPFEAGHGQGQEGRCRHLHGLGDHRNRHRGHAAPTACPASSASPSCRATAAEQRPDRFAVGEKVDAKVTAIDRATRKVTLSIKAREVDEEKQAMAEFGSSDSGASLGDILGAAIRRRQGETEDKEG